MNRGSSDGGAKRGRSAGRFNEAPIHESGKSLVVVDGDPPRNGFNEAPIHESGKYDPLHVVGPPAAELQ